MADSDIGLMQIKAKGLCETVKTGSIICIAVILTLEIVFIQYPTSVKVQKHIGLLQQVDRR